MTKHSLLVTEGIKNTEFLHQLVFLFRKSNKNVTFLREKRESAGSGAPDSSEVAEPNGSSHYWANQQHLEFNQSSLTVRFPVPNFSHAASFEF